MQFYNLLLSHRLALDRTSLVGGGADDLFAIRCLDGVVRRRHLSTDGVADQGIKMARKCECLVHLTKQNKLAYERITSSKVYRHLPE